MNFVQDTYVIQAGDAAAAYASRGYNLGLGKFENLPGLSLTPYGGVLPTYTLRIVELRAWHTGLATLTGTKFWLGVALDHMHPEQVLTLGNPVHSVARNAVSWFGRIPMGGGVVWRCGLGGLIAGDIIGWTVGYV